MLYDAPQILFVNRSVAKVALPADAFDLVASSIDLGAAQDIGENLCVVFNVTTAFVDGGEASPARIMFALIAADNEALTTNPVLMSMIGGAAPLLLGATDLIASAGGFVASALTLGATFYLPIPPVTAAYRRRYVGAGMLQPSWLTGRFSAGAISAHIAHNPRHNDPYPRVG